MDITVLIQPLDGRGFRATAGGPFAVVTEGATREEAVQNLKAVLAERARQGAEIVTIQLPFPRVPQSAPLWPDDEITYAWLEGIAEYRRQCDQQPDPWEVPPEAAS